MTPDVRYGRSSRSFRYQSSRRSRIHADYDKYLAF